MHSSITVADDSGNFRVNVSPGNCFRGDRPTPSIPLLPLAARKNEKLAGDPTGVIGSKEHGRTGDVFGLSDAAQWRLRFNGLAKGALGQAARMESLGFDHARV